ncbi:uncharacterized protein PHACADRAFT_265960 [Phanerochaete carnosa HHB-10118-sp]|uniref:Uncharacterized protein n=1 Tax=Phanerochaete carnosa (strain HHB-10118-sp) TaxID=650164 RepID=K5WFJ5_PHACS|nr:uncharacterized protein PHACADRAFT_265960 [Phanerochaete carnosa HHB-10118-sp]EKM48952.1 hypothetical protein PHACADRAFT_265960 [Phanerochaete carnosa HHB-10118-sp]
MQRFNLMVAHLSYDPRPEQMLTIEPHNLSVHSITRTNKKGIIPMFNTSSNLRRRDDGSNEADRWPITMNAADLNPLYIL